MILVLDIGNTNIVVGVMDQNKPLFVERLSTDNNKTDLEYAVMIKTVLRLWNRARLF